MSDTTPKKTLAIIDRRDASWARTCVMTGVQSDRIVPQHRQGGMGGRADKHRPANVLWLDSILNGQIEDDAVLADVAILRGVKISLHADPELIPVYFQSDRAWFTLTGETRHPTTALEAITMMAAFYGPEYFNMQRNAARSGWTTSVDESLVCAAVGASVVCRRGSARVVNVTSTVVDDTWVRVTCPACRSFAAGEWS